MARREAAHTVADILNGRVARRGGPDWDALESMQVDVREAEPQLSRLVERAAAGEEVVIARAADRWPASSPYRQRGRPRSPGIWQGM